MQVSAALLVFSLSRFVFSEVRRFFSTRLEHAFLSSASSIALVTRELVKITDYHFLRLTVEAVFVELLEPDSHCLLVIVRSFDLPAPDTASAARAVRPHGRAFAVSRTVKKISTMMVLIQMSNLISFTRLKSSTK